MLSVESQWLLSVVKNPQLESVKEVLLKGGDPNAIDDQVQLNALH